MRKHFSITKAANGYVLNVSSETDDNFGGYGENETFVYTDKAELMEKVQSIVLAID